MVYTPFSKPTADSGRKLSSLAFRIRAMTTTVLQFFRHRIKRLENVPSILYSWLNSLIFTFVFDLNKVFMMQFTVSGCTSSRIKVLR